MFYITQYRYQPPWGLGLHSLPFWQNFHVLGIRATLEVCVQCSNKGLLVYCMGRCIFWWVCSSQPLDIDRKVYLVPGKTDTTAVIMRTRYFIASLLHSHRIPQPSIAPHILFLFFSTFKYVHIHVNPFRTAVPFWGQTSQISTSVSPKRDSDSRRVN